MSISSSIPSSATSASVPTSAASTVSDTSDMHVNDVAVVGMACRLAGGIHSPEQLWEAIMAQRDASSEIPSWRWDSYRRRDPRNEKTLGKTTKRGYFLEAIDHFDPVFFGISPKEAQQMDPQQRLSLEVAWEALEDAGIDPESLSGSDTAVFMGVNSDDYSKLLLEDLPNVDAWMGIGTAYCGVPNRISYHLNLMGPSSAVDAACASSLVAIHHGAQSITTGESKVAIVGGVNALLGPGLTAVLDKAGAVSPDGSCLSFDDDAHGYGRGEGAAVVILKNLAYAVRDGDNILGVLKGTAVAQDGKTNGIMAPSAKAQELVARQALRRANDMDPSTVQYVEAHATSTPLGDPTEVSAVAAVYGSGASRPPGEPVMIGSVKPNVGHLEAGAGAVGFIKAVMAIRNACFPPQANLKKLNTKVDWKNCGVTVVQKAAEWPAPFEHLRRAAVCSYGYGGTVSHAIIEETPSELRQLEAVNVVEGVPKDAVLLPISSPQEKRLSGEASALAAWLTSPAGRQVDLAFIANTLALRRTRHDYRAAFIAESHDQAAEALSKFSDGSLQEWSTQAVALRPEARKDVVWVFSGHGAQWQDMGKELVRNAVFYQAVRELDPITVAESGFSVVYALTDGLRFDESDSVQVLTYAVQIGLAAVLGSMGLRPSAIIGHSVGEIAATVVAGSLTPEEGALIVTRRAKLYARVKGQGTMFLVNKAFETVKSELQDGGDVVAAIDSSPSSCVISGSNAAVLAYVEKIKSSGVKVMKVATDIAFHSSKMLSPLAAPLKEVLAGSVNPKPAAIPLYSTSNTDSRYRGMRDIDYWINNTVSPVHLTSAIKAALDDGLRLFLEVSSHPIITHSINETIMDRGLAEDDFAVLPTLRRNKSAELCMLHASGSLFSKGADLHLRAQPAGSRREWSSAVPKTQWLHNPIWRDVESGIDAASTSLLTHDVNKHTLLGLRSPVAGTNTVLYSTKLDNTTKPFPDSNPFHGTEIVPAAVLVNTFHHATQAATLSNITLRVPVAINAPRDLQVVVEDDTVKLASRLQGNPDEQVVESGDHSWVTHTTGRWNRATGDRPPPIDIEETKRRINAVLPPIFSIDYLDKVGVSAMGFPWAVMEHHGNLKEMLARVDVAPNEASGDALPWDPSSWAAILDAATSVGSTIFFDDPKLRMPAQIDKVHFFAEYGTPPPKTGWLYVEEASERGAPAVHVSVCDDDGRVIVKFQSMRFSEIEGTPGASGSVESLVHRLTWVPAPFSHKALGWERAVVFADDDSMVKQAADGLKLPADNVTRLSAAADLAQGVVGLSANTAVIYCPGDTSSLSEVPARSEGFIAELLTLVKHLVREASSVSNVKVFAVTRGVGFAATPTSLAQAPLHGLARIIASEHGDSWGALVDLEDDGSPLPSLALRYVQDQDVVRVEDDMPRVARLQPLPRNLAFTGEEAARRSLLPKPEGTYVITGGLGALGLEVTGWLAEKGARRLVLLSRRGLPACRDRAGLPADDFLRPAVDKVQELERLGVTVHVVPMDIGAPDADVQLRDALARLDVPEVLGVVHAAGTLANELVMETTPEAFHNVLHPKVSGALALHRAFPPGTLDWMVLFSSCGQLFGFPGQSSYASGNAFLDALATHRRRSQTGDTTLAAQWTSWRGLGMAASTDFINAELRSKGITDITIEEGFRAWEHLGRYDIDHGVVLRSLALDEDEPLPAPILEGIAVRRARTAVAVGSSGADSTGTVGSGGAVDADMPAGGPELKDWLDRKVRGVISSVLMLGDADEVDGRAAIADLGVDSVLTVTLRQKLQSALKVKAPPTLTWSHPTANHLVGWFAEKIGGRD
ncbi:type I polyketide synthase [Colletotrichum plurivorum]|uniref:Type I polyketide synthase n=1 Tax=Colletotrichum plurivorum TaxID=2175906 RepID=A0A8H6K1K7_9PEZI|nr:type I polyketide synthase [Colletotrichum plurivorum]